VTIAACVLSLAAGALAKITDRLSDKGGAHHAGTAVGLAYGMAGGALARFFPPLAALFWGLAAGNLFSGKFDSKNHQAGLAAFISLQVLLGFPAMDFAAFALMAAAAFADEMIAEKTKAANRAKRRGLLGETAVLRPLVPIACLAYGVATGAYEPLLAIIAFDAAYVAAGMKAI